MNVAEPPLVLYTEPLAEQAVQWLSQRCRVERCDANDPQFDALLRQAQGLIVRTYLQVDAALLERGGNLKVVARAGIGLDNIDVDACRRQGVEVVYTPDASTAAVVEYVTALIFDAIRPRRALREAVDAATWSGLRRELVGQRELSQCTVGILGLGRIGQRLARVLRGFECRVRYCDLLEIPQKQRHGAQPVDARTLFGTCDIISVHVDGRASNRGMVGEKLLSRLNDDAVLINTSRGMVVDAHALADAMRQRPAARALLDVHDPEPIAADNPLLGLTNVTLLPHLASRTDRGLANMSWVVRDVAAVLDGGTPQHPAP